MSFCSIRLCNAPEVYFFTVFFCVFLRRHVIPVGTALSGSMVCSTAAVQSTAAVSHSSPIQGSCCMVRYTGCQVDDTTINIKYDQVRYGVVATITYCCTAWYGIAGTVYDSAVQCRSFIGRNARWDRCPTLNPKSPNFNPNFFRNPYIYIPKSLKCIPIFLFTPQSFYFICFFGSS